MALTEPIIHLATQFIGTAGYPGITLLMILESMVAPIPSEAVMPFAGFLIVDGTITWIGVAIASTIGSLVGSLVSYWIGAKGGRPLVLKFGKFLLLNEHHLEITERFFQRRGSAAIFISRFIPAVRHFISIPAGVGHMPLGRFIVYTVFGAGIWNMFLVWVGFKLGENWENIRKYSEKIDLVLYTLIAAAVIYYLYRIWRHWQHTKTPTPGN